MNRIEEIKRKHEESVKDGEFRIFASDIEYLLSLIEEQQRTIERYEQGMADALKVAEEGKREIAEHQKQMDEIKHKYGPFWRETK